MLPPKQNARRELVRFIDKSFYAPSKETFLEKRLEEYFNNETYPLYDADILPVANTIEEAAQRAAFSQIEIQFSA